MSGPYYSDDFVTIYHGDCREVIEGTLAGWGRVDLVFTSPPYNMGTTTGGGFGNYAAGAGLGRRGGGGKWANAALADGYDEHGDAMPVVEYEAWQTSVLRYCWSTLSDTGAIFYNHKPRPQGSKLWHPRKLVPDNMPIRQEIIWKRAGGINFAPTHYLPTYEVILVIAKGGWRLKSKGASGIGDVWDVPQETGSDHPCPFPLALPERAIETAGPSLVLDPFMGSGTSLLAAKRAGVKAIGIEKSERYCEMAAERLGGPIRLDDDSLFGSAS